MTCVRVRQIYENYKLKRVDGLSIIFILNWLMGDTSNLLGCILTQSEIS